MIDGILTIKKLHKRRFFHVLALVLIILVISILWQHNMNFYEKEKYNPPGQLIKVDNHKMHIYAAGEGSPTVIFTVGSGTPCAYTDYYYIQKEVSKTARTISYDRPGFGWSESTAIPRTIGTQVDELHELLCEAGEKPPFILVGHSLSSLEVIHYAQMFPEEVLGIVLIDGGNPTFYANYSEFSALALNRFFEGMRLTGVARALGNIGIFPPFVGENQRQKLLPHDLQQVDKIMFYNKLGLDKNRDALKNINENANEVIKYGKIGGIPLVILTAGKSTKEWKESQIQLKSWSSNSKQAEVIGSSHYIHWNYPNIIVEEIHELIKNSKANSFNVNK
jgi:pimeloyl-ACP methyl ester carboxylesterase